MTQNEKAVEAAARAIAARNTNSLICADFDNCKSPCPCREDARAALRAAAPHMGPAREELRELYARTLYKSRGLFDDETVRMHFVWFHDPNPAAQDAGARMAIVHCYRDADAILSLTRPSPVQEGWRAPEGWKLVPVDDEKRPHVMSALPVSMIFAGGETLDQCQRDLNHYVAGKTPDWDSGMIAVAVYRAMTAVAPAPPVADERGSK